MKILLGMSIQGAEISVKLNQTEHIFIPRYTLSQQNI